MGGGAQGGGGGVVSWDKEGETTLVSERMRVASKTDVMHGHENEKERERGEETKGSPANEDEPSE